MEIDSLWNGIVGLEQACSTAETWLWLLWQNCKLPPLGSRNSLFKLPKTLTGLYYLVEILMGLKKNSHMIHFLVGDWFDCCCCFYHLHSRLTQPSCGVQWFHPWQSSCYTPGTWRSDWTLPSLVFVRYFFLLVRRLPRQSSSLLDLCAHFSRRMKTVVVVEHWL